MQQSRGRTLVVACGMLFVLGVTTAVLGPVLPELAARTGSTLADLGAVFTALFLGALAAQTVAGVLADRLGERPVLLGGLAVTMIGVIGVALSPALPLTLVSACVLGLGHGAVDVSTNVLVARTFADRPVTALNVLHVFFGGGAVAGPAMAGLAIQGLGTGLPALYAGLVPLVVLAPLVPPIPRPKRSGDAETTGGGWTGLYRSPLVWVLGLLLLLYVGTEMGMSGWATAYMQRSAGMSLAEGAYVTSAFWLALSVGRMVGATLGARLSPGRVLWLSLGVASAGGLLLVAMQGQTAPSVFAIALMGFGFGPIFPTTVATATARFPDAPGRATSLIVALGSLGGMLLPWIQGLLLDGRGPAAIAAFIAACILAMLALHAAIGAGRRQMAARSAA